MKLIKHTFIVFLAGALTYVFSSCSSFVEGYSVDPNNPTDVTEDLLLPQTMVSLGTLLGEDLAWYSQCFMQTHVGVARQMNAATRYSLTAGDVDNIWNITYAGTMTDLKVLGEKAAANDNPYYAGISKVMMAATLGNMTDCYGDMPWTEALQGTENTTPSFDNSQTTIYPAILSLLDDAIGDLSQSEGSNGRLPGSDDLVHDGDAAAWIATANALKARYLNHYSNAGDRPADVLAAIADAIADNSGDAEIPYGTADPAEANPWYQFNTQRGDLVLGEYFIEKLKANDDPRLPFYATEDANGDYSGSALDVPNLDASLLGDYYGAINASVPIVTYAEVKFIEAEVRMRQDQKGQALAAYTDAVTASVEKVTGAAPPQAFLDAVIPASADDLTMEMIMDQKYLAMFTQLESFVDYRRTGFPDLTPFPGQSQLPGRFPYSLTERNLNPANVPSGPETGIFGKLWWAK